jgi:hypothetical protein
MTVKNASLRFQPRAQPSGGGGGGGASPWQATGTVVELVAPTNTVAIGASAMVGGERVRIVGDLRVEGNFELTGFVETFVRVEDSASGTGAFFELSGGSAAAVSNPSEGRLRYNEVLQRFESSVNGGPYSSFGSGGAASSLTSAVYSCPVSVNLLDAVFLASADNVDQAASNIVTDRPCVGVVIAKPTATTCEVQYGGELAGFVGLIPGDTYYLSTTPGVLTNVPPSTPGEIVQEVGFARNATTLVVLIERDFTQLQ